MRARIAEVDGDRVAAMLGDDAAETALDLRERLVPGRGSSTPLRRTSGVRSRSGSVSSSFSA